MTGLVDRKDGIQMESKSYQIGELQFNSSSKELVFNRYRCVKLSNREALILQYLLDNPNKAITLAELLSNPLAQYTNDPIATRKTIQHLSTKLERCDCIEYPYIDCYMFRYDEQAQQLAQASPLARVKRWFGRMPAFTRAAKAAKVNRQLA